MQQWLNTMHLEKDAVRASAGAVPWMPCASQALADSFQRACTAQPSGLSFSSLARRGCCSYKRRSWQKPSEFEVGKESCYFKPYWSLLKSSSLDSHFPFLVMWTCHKIAEEIERRKRKRKKEKRIKKTKGERKRKTAKPSKLAGGPRSSWGAWKGI